jgi:type II secretory pathway component GspD/PulD (secretin)
VLSADDYAVTIKALEQSHDVDLVSSPRIITLDNMEAKILIGSSEPYDVFQYDQEGHVTGKESKFVEVGIKLTVTPKISKDGFIMMNIRPEVSTPRVGTASTSLAVDTTEANSSMIVKDGQTLVMGGLIKDNKEKHVAKIPFLGDIPFIKYLFRNTYDVVSKKEIIIFITPKIINPEQKSDFTGEPTLSDREERMLDSINDKVREKAYK